MPKNDFNLLLVAFYDKGNIEDSKILHENSGVPILMNGEKIQYKYKKIYCHLSTFKKINKIISFGIKPSLPDLSPGTLYITSKRMIYLRTPNLKAHQVEWPRIIADQTHYNWAKEWKTTKRKESFSLPLNNFIDYKILWFNKGITLKFKFKNIEGLLTLKPYERVIELINIIFFDSLD